MAYETLEQAQARIVELEEEATQLRATNQTLSQDNEKQKKENEDLRTLNQKYFNKLIAQDDSVGKNKDGDQGGSDVPSVEEYVKNMKF
jgi:FtsZ-binding cell division protein ZapB